MHSFTVLVGHSLGGLFAIDSLIEEPGLFSAYIAISPSLHWDEGRELRALQQRYSSLILPPPGFLEGRAEERREMGDTGNAVLLYEMALDIYPDSEDARAGLDEIAGEQ